MHESNRKVLKEWSGVQKIIRSKSNGVIVLEVYDKNNELIGKAKIPSQKSFLITAFGGHTVLDFDVTRTIEFSGIASCKLVETKDVVTLECDEHG